VHNYTLATNIVVPPLAGEEIKIGHGQAINRAWEELEQKALSQMKQEGFEAGEVSFLQQAMVRYGRQLDDLIVISPVKRIGSARDWDALINAFETMYEAIYTKASKFPQAGYEIFGVGLVASVPKIKPILRKYGWGKEKPGKKSAKGKRPAYFDGRWQEAPVYDGHLLTAGNRVKGPAIVEFSTSTFVIPPGKETQVDEYLTFWLR
jgi:acetone carboxylase beta subunit